MLCTPTICRLRIRTRHPEATNSVQPFRDKAVVDYLWFREENNPRHCVCKALPESETRHRDVVDENGCVMDELRLRLYVKPGISQHAC
jgi:hypothetical protein